MIRSTGLTGLPRWSSKPKPRNRSRSPAMAEAVKAMTGRLGFPALPWRMASRAVMPSMTGMLISISTQS